MVLGFTDEQDPWINCTSYSLGVPAHDLGYWQVWCVFLDGDHDAAQMMRRVNTCRSEVNSSNAGCCWADPDMCPVEVAHRLGNN